MLVVELTYQQQLDALRETKMSQTREKQQVCGAMDRDDLGKILPPPELRKVIETVSPSGVIIKDVIMKNKLKSNHPSGGFFGPKVCGENFRLLLEVHPVYVDRMSSLAGGYMVHFSSYRNPQWNPDFDYSHLKEEQLKYGIYHGIGGVQHFCPDLTIGLELGWGGILEKVRNYRKINLQATEFYDGLEDVIFSIRNWIYRHVETAREMAKKEENPILHKNLVETAEINERLINDPPRTFREACQWIAWFEIIAQMYNGSGAIGQLDELLRPYYEQDMKKGILTDEEAIFHIACFLLKEPASYIQIGGPNASGRDVTSKVSFLILEAIHRLKTPASIGIRVHDGLDPKLLRKGVEIMFEDKMGFPKFLGDKGLVEGFVKNGYSAELARERVYSGCHWFGIPGREYTLNDCVKIILPSVFNVALREMFSDQSIKPSVKELWRRFEKHLKKAVEIVALGLDFHMEHMHEVFPELILDLLCYGSIEKGLDASHRGVEFYNLCVDGSSLATVADSFAALEQRIENEGRITWHEMLEFLDNDFAGAENARLMLHNIPRYGCNGTNADEWAVRISQTFTKFVKEKPTPAGFNMIPGLFSWASMIDMGYSVSATPNGRHANSPVSQGANPDPGFLKGSNAPTAIAVAVASVQCGYGNSAPLQLDMDPIIAHGEEGKAKIEALIRGHFALGGTIINMNVIDKKQILEANKDPSKFPDLIVRVTGFSAYFASLSKDLRQFVVDRILSE
jgi:formate C-acetyltransferase